MKSEDGFGLTELLVAMAILAIGLLAVFTVMETAIAATYRAGVETTASTIASAEMERVRSLPWDSIGLDEAAVAPTDADYKGDAAWKATATDRVDVVACGGPTTPCTNMVPSRSRTGADGRTYRVDTYVTWRAVTGANDLKLVTVVVRSLAATGSDLARLNSSFEDDRPNGGGVIIPPPGNRAPVLENPGGRNNNLTQSVLLTLDGSDLDGDPLTYSATGLPAGLVLDVTSGDITGTPTAVGVSTVTATVTDGTLSDTTTFDWTIRASSGEVNLARFGTASQSSTATQAGLDLSAGQGNDGDTDGDAANDTLHQTTSETQAWWEVDLGAVESIRRVRIHNRTDCCGGRLSNVYILVSETPFTGDVAANRTQSVFWEHLSGTAGSLVNVNVNDEGRYVRVRLGGTNILHTAEVEVIATD